VEELRELKASLEQEVFSESDYLNGSSSSLRAWVTDCEWIGSTLGMVSQPIHSSSAQSSSSKQKVLNCDKSVKSRMLIFSHEVKRSAWSFFSCTT